ncbi:MAG: GGDEF domain-containing protein [Clostridia bacterium]|nr:GGDEF domain-containing protein [Clostridia bacterium]
MMDKQDLKTEEKKVLIKNPVWREIIRSAITLAVMVGMAVVFYFSDTPNPNMILIAGVVVFTSMFGFIQGAVATAVLIAYSMFFFSKDNVFFVFEGNNLQKVIVSAVGSLICLFFVGALKKTQSLYVKKLRETNELLLRDNEKLELASVTDSLTTTKNRLAFRNDFDKFRNSDIRIVMLDIDDFKQINDNYSHTAGDYVLKSFGVVIKEIFGEGSCYRYGGDEFLIIAEGLTSEEFEEKAARLQKAADSILLDGDHIPAKFSAGCVYGKVVGPNDLRYMLRQADQLLYEIKRAGKNGISSAEFSKEYAKTLGRDFPSEE